MSRSYRCPACQNDVDQRAATCSSPSCRRSLAFCSHCRDVSTYAVVEKAPGRLGRDKLRCDRCQHVGVRCFTWVAGGYCNGLARAGVQPGAPASRLHYDRPLCALCQGRVGEMARGMVGYALMGAVGLVLKRRK